MELQTDHVSSRTILRLRDVLRMTGLSRSTLYNMIKRKDFPHQVSLGARAVGWVKREVQNRIEARAHLRPGSGVASSPEREVEAGRGSLNNGFDPGFPLERRRGTRPSSASASGKVSVGNGSPDLSQLVSVEAKLYFDKNTRTFWLHLPPERSD